MKKIFFFSLLILSLSRIYAQDNELVLGKKINPKFFIKLDTETAGSKKTKYKLISPQSAKYFESDWDEITVTAYSSVTSFT